MKVFFRERFLIYGIIMGKVLKPVEQRNRCGLFGCIFLQEVDFYITGATQHVRMTVFIFSVLNRLFYLDLKFFDFVFY